MMISPASLGKEQAQKQNPGLLCGAVVWHFNPEVLSAQMGQSGMKENLHLVMIILTRVFSRDRPLRNY